jgi:uncharacterized membrane protein YkoI
MIFLMICSLFAAVAGCGDDAGSEQIGSEAAAMSAAEAIVGGEATGHAHRIEEDGAELWEVEVEVSNGAQLEVLLFAGDGELFEVKDGEGPFDYEDLDPLPGQLSYVQARDVAFDEVEGEQVAWEVKFDDGRYFYEFYVQDLDTQLWEIKLWADNGEVFVVEAKNEVD